MSASNLGDAASAAAEAAAHDNNDIDNHHDQREQRIRLVEEELIKTKLELAMAKNSEDFLKLELIQTRAELEAVRRQNEELLSLIENGNSNGGVNGNPNDASGRGEVDEAEAEAVEADERLLVREGGARARGNNGDMSSVEQESQDLAMLEELQGGFDNTLDTLVRLNDSQNNNSHQRHRGNENSIVSNNSEDDDNNSSSRTNNILMNRPPSCASAIALLHGGVGQVSNVSLGSLASLASMLGIERNRNNDSNAIRHQSSSSSNRSNNNNNNHNNGSLGRERIPSCASGIALLTGQISLSNFSFSDGSASLISSMSSLLLRDASSRPSLAGISEADAGARPASRTTSSNRRRASNESAPPVVVVPPVGSRHPQQQQHVARNNNEGENATHHGNRGGTNGGRRGHHHQQQARRRGRPTQGLRSSSNYQPNEEWDVQPPRDDNVFQRFLRDFD